jgi:hypothetical protein
VEGKSAGYVAKILNKRIKVRGLKLRVTVVSDVVYLEKA